MVLWGTVQKGPIHKNHKLLFFYISVIFISAFSLSLPTSSTLRLLALLESLTNFDKSNDKIILCLFILLSLFWGLSVSWDVKQVLSVHKFTIGPKIKRFKMRSFLIFWKLRQQKLPPKIYSFSTNYTKLCNMYPNIPPDTIHVFVSAQKYFLKFPHDRSNISPLLMRHS